MHNKNDFTKINKSVKDYVKRIASKEFSSRILGHCLFFSHYVIGIILKTNGISFLLNGRKK